METHEGFLHVHGMHYNDVTPLVKTLHMHTFYVQSVTQTVVSYQQLLQTSNAL